MINFAHDLCYIETKVCLQPAGGKERRDLIMQTPDIMIYKGAKEEKYQLYIEDYVMSYLKNYTKRKMQGRIFFYGLRESGKRTFYIFGAASEKQLVFFRKYACLEEILYRYQDDMPMFAIREDNGEYELSGYHIFYQSNEEMQSYMVEQRKLLEQEDKVQAEQNKLDLAIAKKKQEGSAQTVHMETERTAARQRNGLMAVQLSAVFILLVAIVINSTNSYDKLKELGQAATEVFFAMENQDAVRENAGQEQEGIQDQENEKETQDVGQPEVVHRDGTTLYLTELGEELALENGQDMENTGSDEAASSRDESDEAANSGDDADKTIDSREAEKTAGARNNEGENDVISADGTNSIADNTQQTDVIEEASAQAYGRAFAEYYQIEKGDTLYKISQKLYGDVSKVEDICELNQISDPDNIKYGQKILLP